MTARGAGVRSAGRNGQASGVSGVLVVLLILVEVVEILVVEVLVVLVLILVEILVLVFIEVLVEVVVILIPVAAATQTVPGARGRARPPRVERQVKQNFGGGLEARHPYGSLARTGRPQPAAFVRVAKGA